MELPDISSSLFSPPLDDILALPISGLDAGACGSELTDFPPLFSWNLTDINDYSSTSISGGSTAPSVLSLLSSPSTVPTDTEPLSFSSPHSGGDDLSFWTCDESSSTLLSPGSSSTENDLFGYMGPDLALSDIAGLHSELMIGAASHSDLIVCGSTGEVLSGYASKSVRKTSSPTTLVTSSAPTGVRSRKKVALGPIVVGDPNNPEEVKRARNTAAARRSREQKEKERAAHLAQIDALLADNQKLTKQNEHMRALMKAAGLAGIPPA